MHQHLTKGERHEVRQDARAARCCCARTASATILTSPEGTTYTGSIVATSTDAAFDGAWTTITCSHSASEGTVGSHGSGNISIKGASMTFNECTSAVTVKSPGTLEITSSNSVISSGAEISLATSLGTCILTTNNTTVGSLTEGENAIIHVNGKIPRTAGNFLCGSSGTWTGTYDLTTPTNLWVD